MTIFYSDQTDAEAFARSAAFTEKEVMTEAGFIRWGNTMAHELFHSWNGHAIQSADRDATQWFSEGFTEYFTNMALIQQQLISRELYISKMEKNLGLYSYFNMSAAFGNVSLKEAGSKKGMYRLGVYNGGWAAAFALDVMIRKHSKLQRNLGNVMQTLYAKYGMTGKPMNYADLKQAFVDELGPAAEEFFKKYIEGTDTMPLKDILHDTGFIAHSQFYDGEIYLHPDPNAGASAKQIQNSLFHDSIQ